MKKTGKVQCMNISPKGFYEGFLLKSGNKTVQINFPKELRQDFPNGWPPGKELSVEVEEEESWGEPAHRVYKLVQVLGQPRQKRRKFSGTIERLNYALHGEVNGGILDSGDFLHLKPEGARAIGLVVGTFIEARGETRPMADGHFVIEVDEINGTVIERHKAKKKHAK
jgi:hypothetical protein